MRVRYLLVTFVSLLCSPGWTEPISKQQWEALAGGQKISSLSAAQICHLKTGDASGTWSKSGAATFLAGFTKTHGAKHWLQNMEGRTTGDGKGQGNLACRHLSGSCPVPGLGLCTSTTPPAFYWIRRAAATLHSVLVAAHSQLQTEVIADSLQLSQIIQDFSANALATETANDSLVIAILAIAFGFAWAGAGFLAPIFAGLGSVTLGANMANLVAGGASEGASLAGLVKTSSAPDFETKPKVQLANSFIVLQNSLSDIALLAFDGTETKDGLDIKLQTLGTMAGYSGDNYIAGFFDHGAYLKDDWNDALSSTFKEAKNNIKKALISSLLKSLKLYIIKDNTSTAGKNCQLTGSRWINNYCYTIQVTNVHTGGSSVLDRDTMLAFDRYGIDMADVYRNAETCQNKHGFDHPEQKFTLSNDRDSNYPPCFWGSLPVFTIDPYWKRGDICGVEKYSSIPSYLGLEKWCWQGVQGETCPPGLIQGPHGICQSPSPGTGPGNGKPTGHNMNCNKNSKIKGGGCTLSVGELEELCSKMPDQQDFDTPSPIRGSSDPSFSKDVATVGYAAGVIYVPKIKQGVPKFTATGLQSLCRDIIDNCAGDGHTSGTRLGMVEISLGNNYQSKYGGQNSEVTLQLVHIGEGCNPGGGYGTRY